MGNPGGGLETRCTEGSQARSSAKLEIFTQREKRIGAKERLIRGAPASVMATKGGSQWGKPERRRPAPRAELQGNGGLQSWAAAEGAQLPPAHAGDMCTEA